MTASIELIGFLVWPLPETRGSTLCPLGSAFGTGLIKGRNDVDNTMGVYSTAVVVLFSTF